MNEIGQQRQVEVGSIIYPIVSHFSPLIQELNRPCCRVIIHLSYFGAGPFQNYYQSAIKYT